MSQDVLLHKIFNTLILVIALVGHIDMKQSLAGSFQFVVLLGTDAKLAKRYLEIEQIARQVYWLEEER